MCSFSEGFIKEIFQKKSYFWGSKTFFDNPFGAGRPPGDTQKSGVN